MSDTHNHACHVCGEIFSHAEMQHETPAQFDAAHTCSKGHRATVKYSDAGAAAIAEAVKTGADPLAAAEAVDPGAALTLGLILDPELYQATLDLSEAPGFMKVYIYDALKPAVRERLDAFDKRMTQLQAAGKW